MMCYRDMSFCSDSDKCSTEPCSRRFTEEDHANAIKWWGGDDYPVAYMSMRNNCEKFKEAE